MSRPKLEVAGVFRRHGAAWRAANKAHLSLAQRRIMTAIEVCRAKDEAETINAQRNTPKGGLLFRDNQDALVSRPATEQFDENYQSPNFTDVQLDTIAYVVSALRQETRDERDQALAPLEREIAYLKGQLDAVLRMGGISPAKPRESKSGGSVIDLPNWRRRDVA